MALFIPSSSESLILKVILNITYSRDLVVHLYANDHIPGPTTDIRSFTEVSGGGYEPQSLVPSQWQVQEANERTLTPTYAQHKTITWTFNGKLGEVYGYYVTTELENELMWVERFETGPFSIDTNGDKIKVTPRIMLGNRHE